MKRLRTALPRGEGRFDKSSWVTLAVVLVIICPSLAVFHARINLPVDGWDVDIGPWGRYTRLVYLDTYGDNPQLDPGDVLLAVEGTPYEELEEAAARLRPQRPPNWRLGETVRYTVLRDGQEIEVDVTLVRPLLFTVYHPLFILRYPIFLTFPLFLLIGAVAFALRPRERAAQLLFLFGFAFFYDNFVTWAVTPPGVADLFSRAAYWPKIILGNMLWAFVITPVLAHLFLIFPVRKGLRRRYPYLIPALYAVCAAASVLFVWLNVSGRYVSGVAFISLVNGPCLLLIAASMIHSALTVKEPVARMQVRWVALGSIVGIVGPVGMWVALGGISASLAFWQALIYLLLALALPVSLAIAILRYRLWDIDVIINRALVYGALTATLATAYFGSVAVAQGAFRALTGQESQLAVVASTLAIAALFQPLRRRIQDGIDQRFYRRKYDAAQALAAFSATARDEVDLEALSGAMLGLIHDTIQPTHAALWLNSAEADREMGKAE